MTYQLSWLIPNHVLMVSLYGAIAANEVQLVADQMYDMIDALPMGTPVHLIVNIRECHLQEKIWNYARLNLRRHPNNGWSIIVGDSRLFGLVVAIISKILNLHIRYSETPESALKILAEYHAPVAEHLKS